LIGKGFFVSLYILLVLGGYCKNAIYQNTKSNTNGNCWPFLNYDPNNYVGICKKIVEQDQNGKEHVKFIRGFREVGESRFFA
jgi:hypothetical protein